VSFETDPLGLSIDCESLARMVQTKRMGETNGKHDSVSNLDEAEAREYRYWRSRPVHERMAEVSRLSSAMYGVKHDGSEAPRLDKTLVRVKAPPALNP
jgi:hypothetical protein